MQTSAQKARLCYLKNGPFFWLSSCRHLLQLFQRPKRAPAAIVSTVNTYNNKYYFISPSLHLVSGVGNESWGLRASAVKPPWGILCSPGAPASQSQLQGDGLEKGGKYTSWKKEKQEIIEKMRFQRAENIISGAVFGQTCLSISSQNEWVNKFVNFRPWYSLATLDMKTCEIFLLDAEYFCLCIESLSPQLVVSLW